MIAVTRFFRYPKSALRKEILFTKNAYYRSIDAYTNVDWPGAIDDRQSILGYFTFVGDNLVTWRSKK